MGPTCNYHHFQMKGDIMNCSCHRAIKHLEQCIKVLEYVLEKRLHKIVTVNKKEKVTIYTVLILRQQEEYHAK